MPCLAGNNLMNALFVAFGSSFHLVTLVEIVASPKSTFLFGMSAPHMVHHGTSATCKMTYFSKIESRPWPSLAFRKNTWGLSKIPVTFWYVRTPCASPLRALARVRISAYPIHRMQNSRDFCMLQSKSNFLCKPQQKCEEFCGSGLAPRCHWKKCYYQTQIYEESFFVGNPFEGPGSCARGSFGQTRFSHKTLYCGFPGQKKTKSEHSTTNRHTRRNNSPFDMSHH